MKKKTGCIMFIDDNPDDNSFHEQLISKHKLADRTVVCQSGEEGLFFLKENQNKHTPNIIFLDINMPGMDGWEFLEAYNRLEHAMRSPVIGILTSSQNLNDPSRAEMNGTIFHFIVKPLRKEMVEVLIEEANGV